MTVEIVYVRIEILSPAPPRLLVKSKDPIEVFIFPSFFFRMTRTFSLGLVVALLLALAVTEASRGRDNQVMIIEIYRVRFIDSVISAYPTVFFNSFSRGLINNSKERFRHDRCKTNAKTISAHELLCAFC